MVKEPGMVAPAFSPITREAAAGRSLSLRQMLEALLQFNT